MATKRLPRITYKWVKQRVRPGANKTADENLRIVVEDRVNWEIAGANGETICFSNQGAQDKHDARRSIDALIRVLVPHEDEVLQCDVNDLLMKKQIKEVGPGPKPGTPSPIKRTTKKKTA